MSAKRKPPEKSDPESISDDASFVAHYLAVMRRDAPVEVARLAAQMAGDGTKFDPALLVTRAIALRQHAEATVLSRRMKLVADATIPGLHSLHYHLEKLGDAEAGQHRDLIGKKLAEAEAENDRRAEEANYGIINVPKGYWEREKFRTDLEKEVGMPAPRCPSGALYMVQWAIHGLPGASWPVVERAFTDYLCVMLGRPRNQDENHAALEAKEILARLEQQLTGHHSTAAGKKSPRKASGTRKELLSKAIACQKKIIARTEFPARFTPGETIPEALEEAAATHYVLHWNRASDETEHLQRLALLVREFRPFWKQHSDYYLQWGREVTERRLESKDDKKKAGQDRHKWQIFLDAFNRWRKGALATVELINAFPKQSNVTLEKGRAYLKKILKKTPERLYSN